MPHKESHGLAHGKARTLAMAKPTLADGLELVMEEGTCVVMRNLGDLMMLKVTLDEVKRVWLLLQTTPAKRVKQLVDTGQVHHVLLFVKEVHLLPSGFLRLGLKKVCIFGVLSQIASIPPPCICNS